MVKRLLESEQRGVSKVGRNHKGKLDRARKILGYKGVTAEQAEKSCMIDHMGSVVARGHGWGALPSDEPRF